MSNITIYHNPDCATSRNTLALIRNSGEEPTIIEYLKTPPSRETLVKLLADAGLSVRDVLRERGTPYNALSLGEPHWTSAELLDLIEEHPILLDRPIVVTPLGTRLCRPPVLVLDFLPHPQRAALNKEGGAHVKMPKGVAYKALQHMSKVFAFLAPFATLIIAWFAFLFLMFFPPLWLLWPLLVVGLGYINYRGIRYVLGSREKNKQWHHIFNIAECLAVVAICVRFVEMHGQ